MMLIFGPLVAPRISAVTSYLATSAGALTTLSPLTTRIVGSTTVEPISPANLSTVSTSSTATFSCLPPQRTIAYTAEPFLCVPRARLTEQKLNLEAAACTPIGRGEVGALTTTQERRVNSGYRILWPEVEPAPDRAAIAVIAARQVSPRRPRTWPPATGANAGAPRWPTTPPPPRRPGRPARPPSPAGPR